MIAFHNYFCIDLFLVALQKCQDRVVQNYATQKSARVNFFFLLLLFFISDHELSDKADLFQCKKRVIMQPVTVILMFLLLIIVPYFFKPLWSQTESR